ncbi:unnamed protein product [Spirodela intermedia]|uniref:Uncharacterized protein n=1 Tax=Spirodela intermedia TaxID=51605 RepID=A0A7I8J1T0_SPIIN|nr:unnamed protein product [Spirodela intermedia]CAA6664176.1 unnamed protein product [Spirodela intermedia]
MTRILLYNIASNWLSCFPLSAREQIYDSFFLKGPACESVEALICSFSASRSVEDVNLDAVCSNIERILVLSLLKNGVYSIALEFGDSCGNEEYVYGFLKQNRSTSISRMSQLLASVPDKARPRAPDTLSANLFFKHIALQLLSAAYEKALQIHDKRYSLDEASVNGTFAFIGETFARICRRGSADVLVLIVTPMMLDHVRSCFSSCYDSSASDLIESRPESVFWFLLMEEIKDSYAVERLSEMLLHRLATQNIKDEEAYWILWMLFHRTYKNNVATRAMFSEKFLLWKVFPIRCLKWVLQFSVLECNPSVGTERMGQNSERFLEIVQCMIGLWSKREFVQSTSMEQQAYLTAAVGLSLERMSKEELESTKNVLHSILEGVSCRLESPDNLVRKMASAIALVFSRIIDPKQPLYLDDSFGDVIDWEFGQKALSSVSLIETPSGRESMTSSESNSGVSQKRHKGRNNNLERDDFRIPESRLLDPDEIIDPVVLYNESFQVQRGCVDDDSLSGTSEGSSDSSLKPYDLTDDYTDLERKFSQLGDIITALRKPDDLDGVERALYAAETLVRASPDELPHSAGDLVSSLVRLRCSDLSALVALLVMCPFESLAVLNKLIYSPNVDLSQRILITDVMIIAAQELADVKTLRSKTWRAELISPISERLPWFLPGSGGPPGAGPWKEASQTGPYLSWSHNYERELPAKPGQRKGTSRRWSLKTATSQDHGEEVSRNRFPLYAATFMLPAMEGFDKKRQGVDLLGQDFIVLGKLIYMLGTCMRCMARHPEALALAPALLDFLRSREISYHLEAYVRRSVLYAASCVLVALHPSYVASALVEGNQEVSSGLEWVRMWALQTAESDSDSECYSMAMNCLQLHAEMTLQASRALESAACFASRAGTAPLKTNEIVLPFPSRSF